MRPMKALALLALVGALSLVAADEAAYIGGHGDKVAEAAAPVATEAPPPPPPPVANDGKPTTTVRHPPQIVQSHETVLTGGVVEVAYGTPPAEPPLPADMGGVPGSGSAVPGGPAENPNPGHNSLPPPEQSPGGYGGEMVGSEEKTVKLFGYNNGTEWPWPAAEVSQNQQEQNQVEWPQTNGTVTEMPPEGQETVSVRPAGTLDSSAVVYGGPVKEVSPTATIPTQNTLVDNSTNASTTVGNLPVDSRFNHMEYGGVVLSPRVDVDAHCIAWGHPHSVLTFDGRHISFQGLGEFVMYAGEDGEEQVNLLQQRTGRTSFNKGFAFRSGQHVMTVSLESAEGDATAEVVAVRLDGKPLSLTATAEEAGGFSIEQEGKLYGSRRLSVAIRSAKGSKVAAVFYEHRGFHHMNVFLQLQGQHFGLTKGLCGRFNFNPKDDLETPDRQVVDNVEQFATSWAVQHDQSRYWHFLPDGQPFVNPVGLTAYKLSQNDHQYNRAKEACRAVKRIWREECRMNRLQGGRKALEEVMDVVKIAQDGEVSLDEDARQCAQQGPFRLDFWGDFSNCSSACSEGIRTRTRNMYHQGKRCGTVTQSINCVGHCTKANVWAKCAMWGAGHHSTFDRADYDFHATGEFVAYHDPNAKEQVNVLRFRPKITSQVAYTSGAAFRFGADIFTAQLLAPEYKQLKFTFNREEIVPVEKPAKHGFMTVRRIRVPAEKRSIIEVKAVGGTTVTIGAVTIGGVRHLNVFVEIHGAKIGDTRGLCGIWDFNPANDFTTAGGRMHTNPAKSAWTYRVGVPHSFFVFPVPVAEQDSIAPIPVEALKPTDKELARAKRACNRVRQRFRHACVLDVVFLKTKDALRDSRDAQAVVDQLKLSASAKVAQCLRAPGTQLGAPTNWTEACSQKCGGGERTRIREVIRHDGVSCGPLVISKPCNTQPCPINCETTQWTDWSECTTECGTGTKWRARAITSQPQFGGQACPLLNETATCVEDKGCCKVGEWTAWGPCFNGKHFRTRDVNLPKCGHNKEVRPCCELSRWSDWTDCINGESKRTRLSDGDKDVCTGYLTEETKPCCQVSQYGDWGRCVNGQQQRQRKLEGNPEACAMWEAIESRPCCDVGDWAEWSACSKYGFRHRNRRVEGNCTSLYPPRQTEECCDIGEWKPWGECVQGTQTRQRRVRPQNKACASVTRTETHKCCVIRDWSDWSPCIAGMRERNRTVYGDAETCALHQTVEKHRCCEPGEWSEWSRCVNGVRRRTRLVSGDNETCAHFPTVEEGSCCHVTPWSDWTRCENGVHSRSRVVSPPTEPICATYHTTETAECCEVGEWEPWTKCDAETGVVTRKRHVLGTERACKPFEATETKPCCHVHDWSDWSPCENGNFTRTRLLTGNATFCQNWKSVETRPCCEVGVWSDWSKCHRHVQKRWRTVSGDPKYCGGIKANETQACCNVGPWSGWTKCENGEQYRVRTVEGNQQACLFYGKSDVQPCCSVGEWGNWSECENNLQTRHREVKGHDGCDREFNGAEHRTCGDVECKASEWSDWSQCENGIQTHHRNVTGGAACEKTMPATEFRPCPLGGGGPCVVGEWSAWSQCSDGKQERHRVVSPGCVQDISTVQKLPCSHCILGTWSNWTDCHNGTRTRTRITTGNCGGPGQGAVETIPCSCELGEWGPWSTCLNGTRSRQRVNKGDCKGHADHQVQACVDCVVKGWSDWSLCQSDGYAYRHRNVTGDCENVTSSDKQECCEVESWGRWSECEPSGLQRRTRVVRGAEVCQNQFPSQQEQECCTVGEWSVWNISEPGWRSRSRNVTAVPRCESVYPTYEREKYCHVGTWSPWTECSLFPEGKRNRTRFVEDVEHCHTMFEAVQEQPCCHVGAWSVWSECVADPTSGVATKQRTRNVTASKACIKAHPEVETRTCAACVAGAWGPFGACLPEGYRVRVREVHGDASCGDYLKREEKRSCCQLGSWQPWGPCVDGVESRRRAVTNSAYCLNTFPNVEQRTCSCQVSDWQPWLPCDPHTGLKTHFRNVTGDERCHRHHKRQETVTCCEPQAWSTWGACNATTGTRTRTRGVLPTWDVCKKVIATTEEKKCCVVEQWQPWSACAKGTRSRSRVVRGHAGCARRYNSTETEKCCSIEEWSKWSECVAGVRVRTREAPGCDPKTTETKQTKPCCATGPWSAWSPCVNGQQTRTREVPATCKRKVAKTETQKCSPPQAAPAAGANTVLVPGPPHVVSTTLKGRLITPAYLHTPAIDAGATVRFAESRHSALTPAQQAKIEEAMREAASVQLPSDLAEELEEQ